MLCGHLPGLMCCWHVAVAVGVILESQIDILGKVLSFQEFLDESGPDKIYLGIGPAFLHRISMRVSLL